MPYQKWDEVWCPTCKAKHQRGYCPKVPDRANSALVIGQVQDATKEAKELADATPPPNLHSLVAPNRFWIFLWIFYHKLNMQARSNQAEQDLK